MENNFLGIGSNLSKYLFEKFEKNEKVFYIFENNSTFFEIKKEYLENRKILFNNFTLMNKNDFYEKLLETDKIVIKEEKQVILFYNSLNDKIKKELNIENYYDVIEIAYNFYNLFAELQEYKIKINVDELEEWQKPIYNSLSEINENIIEEVQKKGLILPYMLRKSENISEMFVKKLEKIVFINKIYFTPFEKELLEILEKKGIKIENIIQIDGKDFDEKELKIKDNFSIPSKKIFENKYNVNIEIEEFSNKFNQLLGIIKKLENNKNKINDSQNYKIYDTQEINKNTKKDYQLINQNKILYNLEETMENTKIYQVLDILYNILENAKYIKIKEEKNLILKMSDLYKGFKNNEFLHIFNLKKSYYLFQKITSDGYKYISKQMLQNIIENGIKQNIKNYIGIENEINCLINFFEEVEKIYNIETLNEYKEFLSDIFDKQQKIETKIKDKYFEALSEVVVIEDFSFENLWGDFFENNISASLLKLFLKYLDKKSISLDLEEISEQENNKYKLNTFSNISDLNKENIIFLNLQESFPKVKINNYLFSKNQRINMGLPIAETMKQIEIFKFINNILGAKNIYLSYIKNLDENIDCAGIVEEIKLKYNIESKKGQISEEEELEFIKKYFTQNDKWEQKKIGEFIKSKLYKNKEKIKNEKLTMGYYTFEKLREFEYGYYLEKKIGETEVEKVLDTIDAMLFGNIIHFVYEIIVKKHKEELENREFKITIEEIEETLNEVLNIFEYKIPNEFIQFYKKVSFDEISKSIKRFFESLNSGKIEGIEENEKFEIYSEEKIKNKIEKEIFNEKYKNVFLSGVMDLYIKTKKNEILIDYKSGNLDKLEKVEKAQEQLDFYSIILGNENEIIRRKYVVDTWNGEIKYDKRAEKKKPLEPLKRVNIENVLKKYYETDFYGLGEKNSSYAHRTYKNIVRREEEDKDDRR